MAGPLAARRAPYKCPVCGAVGSRYDCARCARDREQARLAANQAAARPDYLRLLLAEPRRTTR